LANREYVYTRRGARIDDVWFMVARAVEHKSVPPQSSPVRVDPYVLDMMMKQDGDHVRFSLHYYDDLGN
jgi:hypothetical protein